MARREPQRREDRQGGGAGTHRHQRFVDEVEPLEPVELEAPPIDGDAVELLVSLLELGEVLDVPPDVEPVPVAPIELVPPVPVLPGVEPVLPAALPVVVLLVPIELEPVVDDGDVEAVEEVDGVEPGVDDPVVVFVSRFEHAPSDRAAATASTPAVIWVMVIFIRKLLERFAIAC